MKEYNEEKIEMDNICKSSDDHKARTTRCELLAESKLGFYVQYTIIFAAMCALVYSYYWFSNRNLTIDGDGWNQYYKANVYYGQYLRSFVRNFLSGKMSLKEFGFSLGEGADIIQTFHYYGIGDPFCVSFALCPTAYIHILAEFIILLRLYCAGISFSVLCFSKKKGKYSTLLATMIYLFSTWGISATTIHVFFAEPMIYFPLIIYGIEKIIVSALENVKVETKTICIYIVSICLSALSSVYFFYMQVLLAVIYYIVRWSVFWVKSKDKLKNSFTRFFKCTILVLIYSIVGVLMAGVIVFPVAYALFMGGRLDFKYALNPIYNFTYYLKALGRFNTNGYTRWLCLGFACPTFFAVYLLFKNENKITLKVLSIVCLVMSCFPIFGKILNGFAYVTNRWSFGIALLVAYVFVDECEELLEYEYTKIKGFLLIYLVYFGLCMLFEESRTISFVMQAAILLLYVLVMFLWNAKGGVGVEKKRLLLLTIVVISIISNAYFALSPLYGGGAKKGIKNSEFSKINKTEAYLANEAAEADSEKGLIDKYSGNDLTLNAGIFFDLSSTAFYWSIASSVISNFRINDMNVLDGAAFAYIGYDDRSALMEIASIKYYAKKVTDAISVPIHYRKLDISTDDDMVNSTYELYENDLALPCGYTYDSSVKLEEWKKLCALDKQNMCIQTVAIDKASATANIKDFNSDVHKIDYRVSLGDGVRKIDGGFLVTEGNPTVTLEFNGLPNSENYIQFDNLYCTPYKISDLFFNDIEEISNKYNLERFKQLDREQRFDILHDEIHLDYPDAAYIMVSTVNGGAKYITYRTADSVIYCGQHDFCVNCGYSEDGLTSATITFPGSGYYKFDDLSVYCYDMSNYENQVNRLKEDVLENVRFSEDKLEGDLNLEKEKVLVVSVPYSEGWSAYVDGVKTKIYKANDIYLGLEVPKGNHKIEFQYKTPFLRLGMLSSAVGFLFFFTIIAVDCAQKKQI